MIALGPIGKMVRTSHLHQIGMKDLNILMVDLVVVTQVMVVASKGIKVNSLNLSLEEEITVKVGVADNLVKA